MCFRGEQTRPKTQLQKNIGGCGIVEDCNDCGFKKLMEENKGMEELKTIVDHFNLNIFTSFQVSLKMDDEA
jgi:hypothetical protein